MVVGNRLARGCPVAPGPVGVSETCTLFPGSTLASQTSRPLCRWGDLSLHWLCPEPLISVLRGDLRPPALP